MDHRFQRKSQNHEASKRNNRHKRMSLQLELGKDFLDRTQKTIIIKEKLINLTLLK